MIETGRQQQQQQYFNIICIIAWIKNDEEKRCNLTSKIEEFALQKMNQRVVVDVVIAEDVVSASAADFVNLFLTYVSYRACMCLQ